MALFRLSRRLNLVHPSPGTNQTFDLTNNGAGIGKISSTGSKYQSKVEAVQKKVADGSVSVPDTVK